MHLYCHSPNSPSAYRSVSCLYREKPAALVDEPELAEAEEPRVRARMLGLLKEQLAQAVTCQQWDRLEPTPEEGEVPRVDGRRLVAPTWKP